MIVNTRCSAPCTARAHPRAAGNEKRRRATGQTAMNCAPAKSNTNRHGTAPSATDMPQGCKDTAGQCERPSPDTGQGTTRLRPTGVAVEDCRGLALNVRPSFRSGRPPSAACHASAPLKEIRKRHRLRSPARAVAQDSESAERSPVADKRHGRCGTSSSRAGGSRPSAGQIRTTHSPPRLARHAAAVLAEAGRHGHKHAIDATLGATALAAPGRIAAITSDPEDVTVLGGGRATVI